MNDINLDDLKIDHVPGIPAKKRMPMGLLIVVFLLGAACLYGATRVWPSLFLGSAVIEPGNSSASHPASNHEGAAAVNSDTVSDPVSKSFTEGGWIEVPSYHPVVVSALIPGRLEELKVLQGYKVKKGDIIAVLYQKDLKDTMHKAEAEVKVAEANLARFEAGFRVQEVERARADVQSAQADVALKEQVLMRTKALLESGAVSAEDLDRDKAACSMAKAKLETLRQELLLKEEGYRKEDIMAAKAEVDQKNALLTLARNNYEYTVIKSPLDGAVLELFVTPGTFILAGNPRIVSLYDPNDLQVRVDVRQENIGAIYLGQQVEVFTDVEPDRSYAGEVIRIEPLADFKKNTIQVKIKVLEPSGNLYPEMIARIKFTRRQNDKGNGEDG
jgi:multidrug resistance efflux pump